MSANLTSSKTDSLAFSQQKQQFIGFSLKPDTAMILPIAGVTEVLKLALNRVVPIPQMPDWTMGVYNWRGEILWMVDLGDLLGLDPWQQQNLNTSAATAIIISAPKGEKAKGLVKKSLGLIVPGVEDIEWCNPEDFQAVPASATTPDMATLLTGYWLKPDGKMVLALDSDLIIDRLAMAEN